ncbi:hypothetical protein PAAG_03510 [Paracoccidioides lutzii Pb01]|uniref:Uncharacterized protein n=1 Tax=Paracoccidioides lutzii (strain ATCC MYA-826 / Pb01) TaxID=502779 RepID=C1GXD6_PARBA|nr:hypothetical protein PAAG_03510 [Paracoccidioides lutzii Pb01]EEH41224.2 hypothetical protein PAAG_03510 [Paracoccidioides lutzii Pb01]
MAITPFREKIKRVFSRSSSGSGSASGSPQITSKDSKSLKPNNTSRRHSYGLGHKNGRTSSKLGASRIPIAVKPSKTKYRANGKPKIELYKAHEVPRSKYWGPFDEAHLRRLAAYSITDAMSRERRPRSMISESPLGTRVSPSRRGSVEDEVEIMRYAAGGAIPPDALQPSSAPPTSIPSLSGTTSLTSQLLPATQMGPHGPPHQFTSQTEETPLDQSETVLPYTTTTTTLLFEAVFAVREDNHVIIHARHA